MAEPRRQAQNRSAAVPICPFPSENGSIFICTTMLVAIPVSHKHKEGFMAYVFEFGATWLAAAILAGFGFGQFMRAAKTPTGDRDPL